MTLTTTDTRSRAAADEIGDATPVTGQVAAARQLLRDTSADLLEAAHRYGDDVTLAALTDLVAAKRDTLRRLAGAQLLDAVALFGELADAGLPLDEIDTEKTDVRGFRHRGKLHYRGCAQYGALHRRMTHDMTDSWALSELVREPADRFCRSCAATKPHRISRDEDGLLSDSNMLRLLLALLDEEPSQPMEAVRRILSLTERSRGRFPPPGPCERWLRHQLVPATDRRLRALVGRAGVHRTLAAINVVQRRPNLPPCADMTVFGEQWSSVRSSLHNDWYQRLLHTYADPDREGVLDQIADEFVAEFEYPEGGPHRQVARALLDGFEAHLNQPAERGATVLAVASWSTAPIATLLNACGTSRRFPELSSPIAPSKTEVLIVPGHVDVGTLGRTIGTLDRYEPDLVDVALTVFSAGRDDHDFGVVLTRAVEAAAATLDITFVPATW